MSRTALWSHLTLPCFTLQLTYVQSPILLSLRPAILMAGKDVSGRVAAENTLVSLLEGQVRSLNSCPFVRLVYCKAGYMIFVYADLQPNFHSCPSLSLCPPAVNALRSLPPPCHRVLQHARRGGSGAHGAVGQEPRGGHHPLHGHSR